MGNHFIRSILHAALFLSVAIVPFTTQGEAAIVADHRATGITSVPLAAIVQAKASLHIAYGHTSHGSQLTTGMTGLVTFANSGGLGLAHPLDTFAWNNGGADGALDLHDYAMGGDVGYYPQWVDNTHGYLGEPDPATGRGTSHPDVNVVVWSWCGQVGGKFSAGVLAAEYLDPMVQLEQEYPGIAFVYMTGHVDHWDDADNKAANQTIRDFCETHEKILYDFADIESYDPDGTYYEFPSDSCDYYASATGALLGNWATEWQASHTEGVDWYTCDSAHSEPLNANRKAYAAWWLWARLGGWDPSSSGAPPVLQMPPDQTGVEGDRVDLQVVASDSDGDTLQFSASGLPPDLTITAATGRITGTLAAGSAGSHSVSLEVSDGTLGDTGTFVWEVVAPVPGETAPVLHLPPDQTSTEGDWMDLQIDATDSNGDTLQFSASGLPPDLTITAATGRITGTLAAGSAGSHSVSLEVSDGTLSDTGTFLWEVVAPEDADGVSASEESGPDGNDIDYDGDGDGLADRTQRHVASFHTYDGQGYVTLNCPVGMSLAEVTALDATAGGVLPAGVAFEHGLFRFTIQDVPVGGTTMVVLQLPEGAAPSTYYKYGPEPSNPAAHWYEFLHDGETGAVISGNVVMLHFQDGLRGDDDLTENGSVSDDGGPAAVLGTPVHDGGGGGGGCFVHSLR